MPISEVHNMDCMEYMKDIPDKFFDLAIVDPPYGLDKKSTRGCGKLKRISLNKFGIDWDKAPEPEYFEECNGCWDSGNEDGRTGDGCSTRNHWWQQ